jgi:hypothetical protein
MEGFGGHTYGRKRDYVEDLGVDEIILLKGFSKEWDGCIDCFDLVQDTDTWRDFVITIINPDFHKML